MGGSDWRRINIRKSEIRFSKENPEEIGLFFMNRSLKCGAVCESHGHLEFFSNNIILGALLPITGEENAIHGVFVRFAHIRQPQIHYGERVHSAYSHFGLVEDWWICRGSHRIREGFERICDGSQRILKGRRGFAEVLGGFAEDRRGFAEELSEKVARVPMCLGLAVLCGPPTVGLSSYFLFYASDTWATDLLENKYRVKVPTSASLLSYTGTGLAAATAYKLQDALVLKQLAAGGRWAYIEPKKINNWMQFWKATGPFNS
jgi:hypothetical protein